MSYPKDFFITGKRYQKRHNIVAERETSSGTVSIHEKDGKIWIESYFGSRQSNWSKGTFNSVEEAKEIVWQNCKPIEDDEMISF